MSDEVLNRNRQRRPTKTGLRFKVKDEAEGTVEAVFATFNVKDHHDDWTLPGAFEDGAQVLISAWSHKSWYDTIPIGRGVIRVEEKRVVLEGQINLKTEVGREHFEMIKFSGDLIEWSYGFDVDATGEVTEELRRVGVERVLKKVTVYEVSPVLLGAGIDTETLSVKAKGGTPEPEPVEDEAPSLMQQELRRFEKTRTSLLR
jgi:HK97 family phage prohead protease